MNRHRSADSPVTPAARRQAVPSSPLLQITLVPLHIRAVSDSVYEALTILGKDCGLARSKPTLIEFHALKVRAGRGNGEQPWL
jgi:hypothetical protein